MQSIQTNKVFREEVFLVRINQLNHVVLKNLLLIIF